MDLLIVGNTGGTNVGESLHRAAIQLGVKSRLCDARAAFSGPRIAKALNWRLLGRRPLRLETFSRSIVEECRRHSPRFLVTTGLSPVTAEALAAIGDRGVFRINYSTDDPWNPAFQSRWFSEALRHYDHVFSVRRSNMQDLTSHGCKRVSYLPFGYDEALWLGTGDESADRSTGDFHEGLSPASTDVFFAGAADRYRVEYMRALVSAGMRIALAGDFWRRIPDLRRWALGHLSGAQLKAWTSSVPISLCLVRRANRDGHVMRSFEIPAIGACMVAEETAEHRAIFGDDGRAVRYFSSPGGATAVVKELLSDGTARLPAQLRGAQTNCGHRELLQGPARRDARERERCDCVARNTDGTSRGRETMRIAIIVHGRFFAFDLAPALLKRGHDVTVFTNYPKWAAARFGVPPDRVRSFTRHGLLQRLAGRTGTSRTFESQLHSMFGSWAARELGREQWDVIYSWSGVSEEIYRSPEVSGRLKLLMRGSSHIRTQAALLCEEQKRAGVPIDQPSQWMIEREEREYGLADRVVVLSTFAYDTFREQGVPDSGLRIMQLGVETGVFRPAPEVTEARRARILSGARLRVLYVGHLSFRKGLADFRRMIEKSHDRFNFRFVGMVTPEARSAVASLTSRAEFVGHRPQQELPQEYAWADLFVFPTVEDGSPVVLAQASAAGLPILTTTNCSGPDLVREGRTGWVLPIRSSQGFFDRLMWCDSHRAELADMVAAAYSEFQVRNWSDAATDFEQLCETELEATHV